MFDQPIDLANARILISNDDGIDATGLRVLELVARSLCGDVWVVAPEQEQSGAGHSLTLRRPLRIRQLADLATAERLPLRATSPSPPRWSREAHNAEHPC